MRRILLAAAALIALALVFRTCVSRPRITNARPSGENVICFGDSLTAGTGAAPGAGYPDHLSRLIGRPVVNAGVPGDTSAAALERLERDVLSRSPRIVCLTLGGNDLKNGVPREEAFAALETIVRRIQATGALVVVGGIDIPLFGRGFGSAYEDLAERTGALLVPDVFDGIMGHPELMSDTIHPNGEGYARMAKHFHRAIRDHL
ncbi:MAG: GDSL-type esterase/lipase family protein [Acidobacteriota bacterium]